MERREMAIGHAAGQADGAKAPPAPQGFSHFLTKLIVDALLFGIISAVLSSPLPLCIGAILYVSHDEFIAWLLRKAGINVIPDSFGASFLSAAVFFGASWTLLTHWKDSLPAWLSAWLPPSFSWPMVIIGALGCAALACLATLTTRKLLPWIGINTRPDSVAGATIRGFIGFAIIGLVYLLLSTPTVEAWLGVQ